MQPLPTREPLLKHVISRAATSPVSLFLTATGLLLLPGPAWPLGIAALAGEAGWLWSRIRDPEYVRAGSDEMLRARWQELVRRLDELTAALDSESASALRAVVDAQERLLGIYASGGALPHTRTELCSLLERCLSLAEKRHQLQGYLCTVRAPELQRQASQLEAKLETTADPVTRDLYEQALEQKRQELENYVRLKQGIERIDGQLAAVRCTFDNLTARVVRMQSADALAGDVAADPIVSELDRLDRNVAALEASLDETLVLRGTG